MQNFVFKESTQKAYLRVAASQPTPVCGVSNFRVVSAGLLCQKYQPMVTTRQPITITISQSMTTESLSRIMKQLWTSMLMESNQNWKFFKHGRYFAFWFIGWRVLIRFQSFSLLRNFLILAILIKLKLSKFVYLQSLKSKKQVFLL